MLAPPVLADRPDPDLDAAFLAMFDQHRHRLFSTAYRLTGRRADAEDLTAETFLRAYRSLAGFDATRLEALQPRAWLSTILVNQWRNQCRASARRPRVDAGEPADTPDPGDPVDVEAVAECREDGRRLAAMLLELPERQRVAVVLRYLGDLPMAEVAEAMGCPVGTAKSHLHRGLRRLRETIEPGGVVSPVDVVSDRGDEHRGQS
jgi:RNA polymerase sigma-70 factor (ECF subfamily)